MAVKFFSTEHKTGEESIKVNQVTKLNIVATPEEPHISTIYREFDNKFDRLPIEVLEMIGGEQGLIQVLAEFDNSDKTDFMRNPYIEFNGTMHIKTNYNLDTKLIDDSQDIYSFDLKELDIFGDNILSIKCKEVNG